MDPGLHPDSGLRLTHYDFTLVLNSNASCRSPLGTNQHGRSQAASPAPSSSNKLAPAMIADEPINVVFAGSPAKDGRKLASTVKA